MMGGQSSKIPSNSDVPTPIKMGTYCLYPTDLSSYEATCVKHPNLQSLDATIEERTNRVITSLVQGIEVHSISIESLGEVVSDSFNLFV